MSPYVRDILSDSEHPARQVFSSASEPSCEGDIVVIGSASECRRYTSALVLSDFHDNVDGRNGPDSLFDFAGERFVSLVGDASSLGSDDVRTFAVRQLVNALDTTYHMNSQDVVGLGHKNRAKIVIFADPECYLKGCHDIDMLASVFSCRIPMIFPFETVMAKVLGTDTGKGHCIGFISDGISSPEYSGVIETYCRNSSLPVPATFVTKYDPGTQDPLFSLLEEYVASGDTAVLDAVIVDATDSDGILSAMTSDLSDFKAVLSDDFRVIDVNREVSDKCFRLMRTMNLFTNKISYPFSETFFVASPDSDISSFVLVP